MRANIKEILADVLEMASDEFSNNTCNDYQIEDTPANRKFVTAMHESCCDPEDDEIQVRDGMIQTTDWLVMSYGAKLLRGE